ncbi:uncharacterized protein LOC107479132 isoform X1 [Arachis duranensis]|uniref:N-acetyltransferase domain-containing protein n=2 Tax=Arachis TaxID=3817 RepID=A0A445DWD7_ARAHY|nr:uncharacterized protein LOC107479132 isoform X1 [Arachis duranensis]XP_025688729.1 uncharacterized protein LOC112790506 isoform X1 [Arachis hypogaea]QHO57518.1 uncharacterized protein DS421_3g82900 [Arachis hypogaea]RYR67467.1 hypothetical protein Ahy_A03g013844 isoform A [Arachis hypogaea]
MPPMATIPTHRPELHALFFNRSISCFKCPKIVASWSMAHTKSSPILENTNDNKTTTNLKKKEELCVQHLRPPIPKTENLGSKNLRFERLQPSDQEVAQGNRFEFGEFVAREAVLDEEYWTAAWLRSECQWENRMYERYIDNFKRKFAEQEFIALRRRCKVLNGETCTCIITVRKQHNNLKHSVLKSVVGTLDLNIRYLLQGETFPGEHVKAPLFVSIDRTAPSRYGYIANLCVTKPARQQGIASNMLYFAIEAAKYNGVTQIYVHVDRNNRPAQMLYQKLGFQMVETANTKLSLEETFLLRLQT